MHIGLLTPEYATTTSPDGGLANYIRKVGMEVAERGHTVSIFVQSSRHAIWKDGSQYVYEVRRSDWPYRFKVVRVLQPLLPVLTEYWSARGLQSAVWKVHATHPIDILQASSYAAPGVALCHNGKIPLVCRVSSYSPLLRAAYGTRTSFGEYLSDWLEIRQVLDAEAAFAPSLLISNNYARLHGYRPTLIRTPIDTQSVTPDPTFYQEHLRDKRYLLFVGTLSRIKGCDLLAEVIPSIFDEYPSISFVFIGRDDGMPGGLKSYDYIRARMQPWDDRLVYFPSLPKEQLYPVIANSIGMLMPSRVDNYPNTCLEALSLGVPVIGTYNSSLDEMILDGETGFLAQNGDPLSLGEAIRRLLAMHLPERQKMRARIRECAAAMEAEDRVGQLISFYETAVSRFRKAS